YIEPGWFTRNVFNPLVRRLARWGVSYRGTRELAVVGRTSGQVRTTVVNLLDHDGRQYLVAPRGNTQWVRNVRAAGRAELRLGRRVEVVEPMELTDDEKPPIIKEYLRRWKSEVGMFFEGIDENATDEQVRAIAPGFPVFALRPAR
ncbi:MAG TPA: nitroreductase family deazaflavin-dependent oxidoreductase, partial [Kineosporiaceae bacterium]|nr:nitroreductase family deazaflavin-dependent oxidoreductase [Kineosporiaceae bacterium]